MWSDVERAGATLKIRPGGPRGKKTPNIDLYIGTKKFVSHQMSVPVAECENILFFNLPAGNMYLLNRLSR